MSESRTHMVTHPLEPVFDAGSRVLILGTMPSPASRALSFYYAHPQNRFWRVLALVFEEDPGDTKESRIRFLLRHGIALWDVLHACEITGAADCSIRHPVPNDLRRIFAAADIRAVFTTGKKAYDLYRALCLSITGREARLLPSTSPANCRYGIDSLAAAYSVLRTYCR